MEDEVEAIEAMDTLETVEPDRPWVLLRTDSGGVGGRETRGGEGSGKRYSFFCSAFDLGSDTVGSSAGGVVTASRWTAD